MWNNKIVCILHAENQSFLEILLLNLMHIDANEIHTCVMSNWCKLEPAQTKDRIFSVHSTKKEQGRI